MGSAEGVIYQRWVQPIVKITSFLPEALKARNTFRVCISDLRLCTLWLLLSQGFTLCRYIAP